MGFLGLYIQYFLFLTALRLNIWIRKISLQKSLNIDKYGNNTHPDWFVQLVQSIELVETEMVQLEYFDYHINEIVQFQTG